MTELNPGLDAGDETRRHGDYIGFPHGEGDGTAYGDISGPREGELVKHDGSEVAAVDLDGSGGVTSPVLGVLYTYPYYGDSSRNGPYVDGEEEATVAMRGAFVADLTPVVNDVNDSDNAPGPGDVLGPNGEVTVLSPLDGDNHAEVRLR